MSTRLSERSQLEWSRTHWICKIHETQTSSWFFLYIINLVLLFYLACYYYWWMNLIFEKKNYFFANFMQFLWNAFFLQQLWWNCLKSWKLKKFEENLRREHCYLLYLLDNSWSIMCKPRSLFEWKRPNLVIKSASSLILSTCSLKYSLSKKSCNLHE
jgi:hypothetical protein